ncbi:hypothetical protein CEUSTIGMA_g1435.t1 [Chlamydomonas eustigma]|uniref:Uncharacterized protein n=1 Tax=Chlamydomonas eustigma TaxID=1157962 RepID=A0A250WT50_9CHLO|nr:hypothetical protein CEUSTIGMA_g1435.t1 [Chlamydomonas eustigma]|eukprot:GAX73985.1 hypothetical protein CEUSTIGMA_g1435.t1 [Chlamydomonas eustigma]
MLYNGLSRRTAPRERVKKGSSLRGLKACSRTQQDSLSPQDTTFQCLTALRRPDIDAFRRLIVNTGDYHPSSRPITVGGVSFIESGPLAPFASVLDVAARRTLPGHLLRRCRILSSIPMGDTCVQRVAITAFSGEENVFVWKLQRESPTENKLQLTNCTPNKNAPVVCLTHDEDASLPAVSSKSSSLYDPSWVVVSINKDASQENEDEIPDAPHPRLSPELVIRGQLFALRSGHVRQAASFQMLQSQDPTNILSSHLHVTSFRATYTQPAFDLLHSHSGYQIVTSVAPTQRTFMAEVLLHGRSGEFANRVWGLAEADRSRNFVFELGLVGGCWRTEMIRAV